MKNKQWLLPFLLCFVPILFGVIAYPEMPSQMPVHFNTEGIADGYASKEFALFGIPLIMAGLQLLCVFAMKTDPKRINYSEKLLTLCFWITPVLSIALSLIIICTCLGMNMKVDVFVPVFVGVVLIVIGNYLPKVKQNYTMGIKIPWTLNSEENWRKTHRVGGFAFVAAGLWVIITVVLGVQGWISVVPLFAAVFVPTVYSWLLYRKETNEKE